MIMVAMDLCDFVTPIHPVKAINLVLSQPTQRIFVDCRSFLSYNVAHIRDSVNIHCPPILRRRFQRGSATLSTLLTCPKTRNTLAQAETLIYYADGSYSEQEMTIAIVSSLLQRENPNYKHYILKGGFERFSSVYPSMCDYMKANSPLALKLKSADNKKTVFSPLNDSKHERMLAKEDGGDPVDILPYLYLGNEAQASRKDILQRLGITSIINVSSNIPNSFKDEFEYKNIPVEDTYNADIESWFEEAVLFIDNVKNAGGRVLVHCQAGISRSATICLAYLIGRLRFRLDEAYEYVKKRRSVISPNFNFMGQLLNWESLALSTRRSEDIMTPSCSNYGYFNFSSLPCGSEIVPSNHSPGLVTTPI